MYRLQVPSSGLQVCVAAQSASATLVNASNNNGSNQTTDLSFQGVQVPGQQLNACRRVCQHSLRALFQPGKVEEGHKRETFS